jgi:hypothetical protein
MKSREILIQDEFEEPRGIVHCDASSCDDCLARFKCFTSSGKIVLTYALEEIDSKLDYFNSKKWRLRDGSSRERSARAIRNK